MLHCTAVTKQWTAKWLYVTNAVFRIVQNHGGKSYFRRLYGDDRPNHLPPGSASNAFHPFNPETSLSGTDTEI